jgi:hypothetical protein
MAVAEFSLEHFSSDEPYVVTNNTKAGLGVGPSITMRYFLGREGVSFSDGFFAPDPHNVVSGG